MEAATKLCTTASVISCVSRIEQDSAALYERLAERHKGLSGLFTSFAKENKGYEKWVRRAYYNVVSDALETGFCFDIAFDPTHVLSAVAKEASPLETLRAAISFEKAAEEFYRKAAEQAKVLLADVSRAMEKVGRARSNRLAMLAKMLDTLEAGGGEPTYVEHPDS